MKIKIIYLLAIVLTSCNQEEFLTIAPETSPSSATFFANEDDFQQAVNGAYAPLRSIVNDRAWLLGEMRSDNTYFARNPLFGATEQQEDIADFAIPSANGVTSNTHVLNQYRLDYLIISRTNQILLPIDEVEFSSEELKNNIKGQALFLRAYAYFELVRYFGSVPLHLTPVSNREEAALPLASNEEIYIQIIEDAKAAAQMLPPKSQQEPGRATSGAAKTLLANVFIVQKEWAQAETLLLEVVNSNEYTLMPDYNNAFSTSTANKNNMESVFEVQFIEGTGLSGSFLNSFMPRNISAEELESITGTSNPQPLSGEGNNIPTPDIIAAYEAGDERKDASIDYITLGESPWKDGVYPYIKKYAKHHSIHGSHGMNWPIYRYSEVLLFLAEAQAEQGKEATTYLNMVRNRAGLDDYGAGGNILDGIYHERRVELAFENKRWFDLVRTGKAIQTMTAFGNSVFANPLDYYYPEGSEPRAHAFTTITELYSLPADEAALSPYF